MKKSILLLWMVMTTTALIIGCGKDDEKAPVAPAAPAPTSTPTPCGTVVPSGIYAITTPIALVVDRIHAFPVSIDSPATVNTLGLYMNSATATNARVALYTNTTSTLPGILLSQSGVQAMNSNEVTRFNIPAVAVAPDLYWIAVIFSGEQPTLRGSTAGTLRYYSGSSPTYSSFPQVMPAGSGTYSTTASGIAYLCN